ncbi:hypothetical protein PU43_03700, partial [Escherichia coli]|uniref:hypothetical protein n=1 Tax=Escherichia coli TaxID=562 RepID=UPI00054213D4
YEGISQRLTPNAAGSFYLWTANSEVFLADCNFYISAEADSQIPHENTPAALATGEEIISAIP